jgi:hypothetical protein
MTFEEVLDQAMAMLQRRGRVTYRTLQRQFQLDDAALDDLLTSHPRKHLGWQYLPDGFLGCASAGL